MHELADYLIDISIGIAIGFGLASIFWAIILRPKEEKQNV